MNRCRHCGGAHDHAPNLICPGGFTAPLPPQKPTPAAVRAAGARLVRYALDRGIPPDVPILDMVLLGTDEEVAELARDQRLLQFFIDQQPSA